MAKFARAKTLWMPPKKPASSISNGPLWIILKKFMFRILIPRVSLMVCTHVSRLTNQIT